jgi:hypothetical protein
MCTSTFLLAAVGTAYVMMVGDFAGMPPGSNGPCGQDENGTQLNERGEPYPRETNPLTGDKIPFPQGARYTPPAQRTPRTNTYRPNYIKWYEQTFGSAPYGGWDAYAIHHIQPLSFGGTNDISNLVHLKKGSSHDQFTNWWKNYEKCF